MNNNNVYLVSCHSSVINSRLISLPDNTSLVTYGEVGDCNMDDEFENVYNAFFNNYIPRDINDLDSMLKTLEPTTSNKNLKLHTNKYHNQTINLCSYKYYNGNHESGLTFVEDSVDAENVVITLSGVFMMGRTKNVSQNKYITINKTYSKNASKGWFEIMPHQAEQIYAGSIFPSPQHIKEIFEQKKVMRLEQFIQKIRDLCPSLSELFRIIGGGIYILSGCRQMDDLHAIHERRLSSEGLRRQGTIIPINTQSKTNKKVFKIPTMQKTSRTNVVDSLANIGSQNTQKKSSRTNTGDSLLTLTLKKGGRTKRNNKSKRKRTKRRY